MSVHKAAKRDLWFAKWREEGKEKRRYFKTEQEAHAFELERLQSANEDDRLTVGELVMRYFRSHPDRHPRVKRNIVYILTGHEDKSGKHIEGPGEFLRDKYAESLSRMDLERLREAYRARGASNASMNRYQAYLRAILSCHSLVGRRAGTCQHKSMARFQGAQSQEAHNQSKRG